MPRCRLYYKLASVSIGRCHFALLLVRWLIFYSLASSVLISHYTLDGINSLRLVCYTCRCYSRGGVVLNFLCQFSRVCVSPSAFQSAADTPPGFSIFEPTNVPKGKVCSYNGMIPRQANEWRPNDAGRFAVDK